ncbi:MAG: hypothetical protein KKC43_08215 [Alphaproteobacteria bacterium]|nr:hypothetical protein [Alphaproteobacteria bacterium]
MIKKLLAATSVAALIAGGAQAQLALEQTSVTSSSGAVTTIASPYVLADEVDLVALNATPAGIGQFGLEVLTEGVIPPGQNIFLAIQVTNGTIASNLNGSEFPALASGITGAVVNQGGTTGATSVRYLITTDAADNSTSDLTRDGIALNLPVRAASCGDVTFAVTMFQTETGGTKIEGGTAVLTSAAVPIAAMTCESVFDASLTPDTAMSVLDLQTPPAFSTFDIANDAPSVATLGDFALAFTPGFLDLAGTPAVIGNVLGFVADIDFQNTDEIVSGQAIAGAGAVFATAATVATGSDINLVSTTAATAPATGTFDLTISTTAPVAAQTVSVSDAVLTLDTSVGLKATDAFTIADVEDLKYEGNVFGPFDWVSDSTKAVNSIFRITGLDPAEDVPAQIIVTNSRNGSAFNGVYPFTILGSSVQGSEVRLNSSQLEAVAGQFGTADISMVFSTTLDLDVDRLNASPSSSVVTPFGDNSNSDSTPDTTTPATTLNDDQGNF